MAESRVHLGDSRKQSIPSVAFTTTIDRNIKSPRMIKQRTRHTYSDTWCTLDAYHTDVVISTAGLVAM